MSDRWPDPAPIGTTFSYSAAISGAEAESIVDNESAHLVAAHYQHKSPDLFLPRKLAVPSRVAITGWTVTTTTVREPWGVTEAHRLSVFYDHTTLVTA